MLDVGKRKDCMKTADKLMAVSVLPLVVFAAMFFGAIIGEIRGSLSREQVTMIMEYAMIPLFIAVVTLVPACFMPPLPSARPN